MDNRVKALTAVMAAGSLAVILYLTLVSDQPVFWLSALLLGLLMMACEALGEGMASGGRSTYGIIALCGAVVALNTPSAMIVALFAAVDLRAFQRREDPWKLGFNAAMYAVVTWAVAAVYHAMNGASRAFTGASAGRSIAPLLVATLVFWALNACAVGIALLWSRGVRPRDWLIADALRLLPNQIAYALVGLALGIIYAQEAFYTVAYADGSAAIVGSTAGSLRGIFAVACFTAILGVAWYYSGKNIELLEAYDLSIEVLVTHLERREPYLDGHAVRVANYAALIGKRLKLPLYEVNRLRHAGLLHDLGRPAIPQEVLLQPMPLSEEEFEKIKAHPLEGASRLEEVAYLADMAEAVRHHHEYYDGGGYIDHLSGDTIPLTARIIAVADAYDAMLHDRPWREAKGHERAVAELRENSGRQFDPAIVEHLIASLEAEEGRRAAEEAAGEEAATRERAAPAGRGREPLRPGKRRPRRREELLRERREARERIEREAMRELGEEPPIPSGPEPGEGGGDRPPPGPPAGGGEAP